jgi:hypothetical protein
LEKFRSRVSKAPSHTAADASARPVTSPMISSFSRVAIRATKPVRAQSLGLMESPSCAFYTRPYPLMHKGTCDGVSRLFKTYTPARNDTDAIEETLIRTIDFEMQAENKGRDVHSYINSVERWWPFRFPCRSGQGHGEPGLAGCRTGLNLRGATMPGALARNATGLI